MQFDFIYFISAQDWPFSNASLMQRVVSWGGGLRWDVAAVTPRR